MKTLFSGRHIGVPERNTDMAGQYLRRTFRGISKVWDKAQTLNLENCLFLIFYNITISWFYPLNVLAGMAQWWERSPPASGICGPGSIPARCHMCEFVVNSRLAPKVFFFGFSVFWFEDCLVMFPKQAFCSCLSSGLNNNGCYTTSNTYSRKPLSCKIVYNCR